jgi:hypothetical protein
LLLRVEERKRVVLEQRKGEGNGRETVFGPRPAEVESGGDWLRLEQQLYHLFAVHYQVVPLYDVSEDKEKIGDDANALFLCFLLFSLYFV